MNRIVFALSCISLFTAIGGASDGADAEVNGKYQTVKTLEFFPEAKKTDDDSTLVLRYKHFPIQGSVLLNVDYEYVVREFWIWMDRFLRSEYVPPYEFVAENLCLYPAKGAKGKEDVAMLAFTMKGKRLLVVQTGGPGRIWIYIQDDALSGMQQIEEENLRVRAIISRYIRDDYVMHIPEFEISQKQGMFIGKPRSFRWQDMKNYVRYARTGADVCLSLEKISFTDTVAAHTPMPDEWFSFEKGKMERKAIREEEKAKRLKEKSSAPKTTATLEGK